jgi:hypothetical protein
MALRLARLLCLVALGAMLTTAAGVSRPASALADGDPASDVLLGENVFYPYSPAVPRSLQLALNAVTAKAKGEGFPVKVALIAAPTDLGVIPDLFGKPQPYARFLDQEISFTSRQRLLVVMATGYGLEGFDGPAQLAARALPKPSGLTSTDLARAALIAVPRLAAAAGHPIRGVRGVTGQTGDGGSSSRAPLAIGLAGAALLVAVALVVLRRRTTTHAPS